MNRRAPPLTHARPVCTRRLPTRACLPAEMCACLPSASLFFIRHGFLSDAHAHPESRRRRPSSSTMWTRTAKCRGPSGRGSCSTKMNRLAPASAPSSASLPTASNTIAGEKRPCAWWKICMVPAVVLRLGLLAPWPTTWHTDPGPTRPAALMPCCLDALGARLPCQLHVSGLPSQCERNRCIWATIYSAVKHYLQRFAWYQVPSCLVSSALNS